MRTTLTTLRASSRSLYRNRDLYLMAAVLPLVALAILALLRELRFETPGATIDFFDFAATGIIVALVVYANQHGMVGEAAGYRATGILKRIAAAPIRPAAFIAGHALSRVGLGVAQGAALLAIAAALGLGVEVEPGLLWVIPIMALVMLTAISFAFAIAGISSTPQGANSLDNSLVTIVFMFGGAMFPLAAFPDVWEDVAEYAIPFAPLIAAIRGIVLDGDAITAFGGQLLAAGGWLVLVFLIAVRTYRFGEERRRRAPKSGAVSEPVVGC